MTTAVEMQTVPREAVAASGVARHVQGRELIIAPSGRLPRIPLRELWAYRGLLYFLIWRDLKVRYTQTVLGVAWAALQPLLNTLVLTLVFGRLVRVPTGGVPYPIFALAAVVPWTYVSTAFATSGQSLLNNSNLITKIYFPRLVIPWGAVGSTGVDFVIGLALMTIALVVYGRVPPMVALLVVPGSLIAFIATAAGVGCWTAALSLKYRDVKHLIPFAATIWMYASPVVYPMSKVPDRFQVWYNLNPLAGTLDAFRSALVGGHVLWAGWIESTLVAIVVFVTGTLYFQRTERVFADIV
jgi:lipopolysaccharide transport system permease protein